MKTKIIRWVLEAALIYGVYTETGIWTALAMVCAYIGIEGLLWLVAHWSENMFPPDEVHRAMFGKFHDHPDR